jgi:hypothetical protein
MKKINAQINRTGDQNKSASPDKIKSTPMIMGFLIYRYGPLTTKVFGGFQGAGVPFPNRKKRRIVVIARNTPMTKNDIDATRILILSENAMFSSKKIKEMHKRAAGVKTVAVPGRRRMLHSNDFIIDPKKNHDSYKASCSKIGSRTSDGICDGCMFCIADVKDIPLNFLAFFSFADTYLLSGGFIKEYLFSRCSVWRIKDEETSNNTRSLCSFYNTFIQRL